MQWDIRQYAVTIGRQDGGHPDREAAFAELFPTSSIRLKSPHIIVDIKGRILAWYLPNLLPPDATVSHYAQGDVHRLTPRTG